MPMRRGCDRDPSVEAGSMREHPSIRARQAATQPGEWVSVALFGALCAQAGGARQDCVEAVLGTMEKAGKFREARGELLGRGCAERYVTQFSPGARGFPIEVEMSVANGENFSCVGSFADQVEHRRAADRQGRTKRKSHH